MALHNGAAAEGGHQIHQLVGETVADLGRLTREEARSMIGQEMSSRLFDRKLTLRYGEDKQAELTGLMLVWARQSMQKKSYNLVSK